MSAKSIQEYLKEVAARPYNIKEELDPDFHLHSGVIIKYREAEPEEIKYSESLDFIRFNEDIKPKIEPVEIAKKTSSKKSRTSTMTKRHKCNQCDFATNFKGSLTRHIRTHTGERPYECSQCSKRFTQSGNRNRHLRIHTGEKPFGCTICWKRFTSNASAKRHMEKCKKRNE